MKRILLFCVVILSSLFSINTSAQVGIGITTPTEKLQVDSGSIKVGRNVYSSSYHNNYVKFGDGDFVMVGEDSTDDRMLLVAKDFIFGKSNVGYTGNVGIGTSTTPVAKLDVNGNVRINDGTQGSGKVLTSDGNGIASWQTPNTVQTMPLRYAISLTGVYPSNGGGGNSSPDTYIGEIKIFPYFFIPDGWIECKGQILPIANYSALFSLIGVQYGGNGTTNFAVPNLTSKAVLGQ